MIGLNLLPDIKKEFLKAQRTRNVVISLSILAMLIVGGATVALGVFVYIGQNAVIALQKNDIKNKQSELAAKPEISKYLTIQNQLDALKVLHSDEQKSLYSRLFSYLTKLNPAAPNSVSLSSAKVAREGTAITIQGSARNFKSLDVFKNTLEKAQLAYAKGGESVTQALFSQVSLKSASLTETNNKTVVTFEFELLYSPEAFQPSIKNVQLSVPKQEISDSKENAPRELFTSQGGSGQ